ncbi:MAG: hypothetical protein JSW49_08445 [candidate division WOR-3 bacterium]|nr:MAG: hypothetical protein JSW49_08445 [candidate division WOR-3 bacterium]
MTVEEIEDRVGDIEKKLDQKKKSVWDIFLGLGAVLIPATIALVGYLIAHRIEKGQLGVAQTNVRVDQSELIRKFMTSLTSKNTDERALAVFAVTYAVPVFNEFLVTRETERKDTGSYVEWSAKYALDIRLNQLIEDLYAPASRTRTASAEEIIQVWRSDTMLVPKLLNYAKEHMDNDNGIYNTVVVLNSIDPKSLTKYESSIKSFLDEARKVGPKTRSQIDRISSRLSNVE